MLERKPLSDGAKSLFDLLRNEGPKNKGQLQLSLKRSERMVRLYLDELFDRTLVKELPTAGRTKYYASIDYVPQIQPETPLAQRWQVYSKATNSHFTIGELATAYANGHLSSSSQAAELLFKIPALLCYFASIKKGDMPTEQLSEQLMALKVLLNEASDQLSSAIGVFAQLVSDPRYWNPETLKEFENSPDYVLHKDLVLIIERLREAQEQEDHNG